MKRPTVTSTDRLPSGSFAEPPRARRVGTPPPTRMAGRLPGAARGHARFAERVSPTNPVTRMA